MFSFVSFLIRPSWFSFPKYKFYKQNCQTCFRILFLFNLLLHYSTRLALTAVKGMLRKPKLTKKIVEHTSQMASIHNQLPLTPFQAANIYSGIHIGNRVKFVDGQTYYILSWNITLLLHKFTPTSLNKKIENQTKYWTWKIVLGYCLSLTRNKSNHCFRRQSVKQGYLQFSKVIFGRWMW